MKQLIQNIKSGETTLEEVPVPMVREGCVLIQTAQSLVSLGTERMLVRFGKSNYLQKARQQPEKVKEVLNKVKTDGVKATSKAVFNKLNQPLPLGYCNVGKVVAVGKGVEDFKIGDRVASNGPHAEVVCVPKNLAAKIPENVSYDEACFTVIGAIGLQGIRLLNPTLGETIVVYGLGLIGLIACDLLLANGCRVIGIEFDEEKCKIAQKKGVTIINPKKGTDPIHFVEEYTQGIGVDGVLITASSESNDIIHQAAQITRKRGKVVLVGVIGLQLNRSDFYKKEITFQVSCSYGPGRYDENYEIKGNDYPIEYVRWTEKRNFECVLEALGTKKLEVSALITEKVSFTEYDKIYTNIENSKSIASILTYDDAKPSLQNDILISDTTLKAQKGVVGIIGAGNFTNAVILPHLKKLKIPLKYIASSSGLSATLSAKRFKIQKATTDYKKILEDKEIDAVFITTRHNSHASMVLKALEAEKNVFVEKPLAVTADELAKIIKKYNEKKNIVCVGFNRRFAPFSQKVKSLLGDTSTVPLNISITVNAGYIPSDVWVQSMEQGGRIIGEACHFIDLATFFTGSKIKAVFMNGLGENPKVNTDNASISLSYANGSNVVINYFSNGSKLYSKERIEIFTQQKTILIDNWRTLSTFGFSNNIRKKTAQNKGHFELLSAWISNYKQGKPIISFEEIVNTTNATFAALKSLEKGNKIAL